ncbi:hypothetical protein M5E86_02660 [Blautia wexlerae]|nr:hypothetical protein M5E86_02660 [Blautia wexlerae]
MRPERINRKDTVIRQNNAELEELRNQYENLDICEEDKQVIDDYIACKDARADRMAEKLYEKGRKDVKRCIRIRKLIRRCMILSAIVTVVLIQYNKNEKLRESLEELAENVPGRSVGRGFITDINNADKNVLSESFCKSKYKEDFESAQNKKKEQETAWEYKDTRLYTAVKQETQRSLRRRSGRYCLRKTVTILEQKERRLSLPTYYTSDSGQI